MPSAAKEMRLRRERRMKYTLGALLILTLVFASLYQFAFINPKFFDYAVSLRAPRLVAILTAGFAIAGASIVFQTIIETQSLHRVFWV